MIVPSLESVPAAVFSSRKLLGYTRAFAERFFQDPLGKPPSLTLNTFLGDWNVTFAREIKAMRPETLLERELRLATPRGEHTFRVTASASVADDERTTTLILEDVQAYITTIRSLEESEARARVLVDTRSAAIALIRQGKFVYVNKGYLELFGYLLREDLVGKDVTSVVAGREKRNIAERLQRPLSADTPLERFEYTGVRKDGSRVYVQVLEELIDVEGEPTQLWYHVDVTHLRTAQQDVVRERKENEILSHILEALHKSVERSEVVPHGLHASLRWFSYESGCVLMVNDTNSGFFLEHQENLSERLQDALRELNMNEGLGGFLMKTMEPVRFTIEEYPPYLPYKSLFESEGIKRIVCLPLSGSGAAVGIVILLSQRSVEHEDTHASFLPTVARHLGFAVDKAVRHQVTAQRAADYQTTLESLSDVVYETAPNGQYRYCSPAVERLTGYKVREVTASSDAWRAIVHPDDRSLLSQRISRQSDQDQEFVLEYRILPKGKAAYKWVRDAVRYRRDANGAVLAVHGIVSDITAGKTGELELQRSGLMSRGVVDGMRDAVMITDLEGKILDVNNAFSELTGYGKSEALGQVLPYPWLHEEQMATFVQWLNTLREAKKVSDFDMQWVGRDGTELPISLSTILLRGVSGEPIAILNFARSSGGRRALSERDRMGLSGGDRMALSEGDQGVEIEDGRMALTEGDGGTLSEGDQMVRGEGDRLARNAADRMAGDATDRMAGDGSDRKEGTASDWIAGATSDRQGSGEEFRQTGRQLAMLSAISQGLAGALDTQSVFALLHKQMREPLSYGQLSYHEFDPATNKLLPVFEAGPEGDGSVTGSSRDALNVDDFPRFARAVSTKEPWSGEGEEGKSELLVPIHSKDRVLGILRLVRQHGEPFETADLRIVASIGNLLAIALERVALHDETVANAREIAFRNEELDRFTYVVSHDLKEPLITINGYTRLALDAFGESTPEDVRGHLDSVMRSSVRMKQLIDDLLTLSRVGREQGQPAVISVAHVVEDLVHDLEFMLQERNAKVEYPDDLPSVRYDPTHLSMVFRNLIVNGVKYNQNTEKLIRIAAQRQAGAWEFSVSDNGIGIEVRDFQKIFTIFQRLDPADGAGGTGAGLTIVKKIVESNGGTIRLESEKGRGSTFTFTVPDHG